MLLQAADWDWPTWGADLRNTGLQTMLGAMSEAPSVKWGLELGAAVEWQFSAAADLEGDGQIEVLFTTTNGLLYCVDGASGSVEWVYQFSSDTDSVVSTQRSSPTVADLDGDGSKEVVFGSHLEPYGVYCVGSSGSLEWFTPTGPVLGGTHAADLDGDGVLEVLVSSDTSDNDGRDTLYSLDGATGAVEWKFAISGAIMLPTPAVADLDGDGSLEVILSATNPFRIPSESTGVYCLDGRNGNLKWAYHFDTHASAPAVGDVDGDGQLEVLVTGINITGSTRTLLVCLNSNGAAEWSTVLYASMSVDWPFGPPKPSLGDANGDGVPEVFAAADKLYCVDGRSGSILWGNHSFAYRQAMSLADVDGDERIEVIAPASDTLLLAVNAEDGSLLWSVHLPGWNDVHGSFVADIDGDQCVEILVGLGEPDTITNMRFLALDDAYDSSGCGPLWQSSEEGSEERVLLRAAAGELLLGLGSPGYAKLDVYDGSGRLVRQLWRGYLPAGTYRFKVRLGPGVYLASLRYGGKAYSTLFVVR